MDTTQTQEVKAELNPGRQRVRLEVEHGQNVELHVRMLTDEPMSFELTKDEAAKLARMLTS